ncbi:restriction endonuclease subunit S [Ruminococcus sp.]
MTAQQLKNSILQMAVQGKLVPQDPGDEPASVLLQRIKAEKQELIKVGKIKKDKKSSEIFRGATHNLPYAFCEQIGKEIRDISDEIPFEIPDSWEWVRLGMIGETNIGLTYRPADKTISGGTLVLRSSNIQNDRMDYSDTVYVSCEIPERAMIHKGDILICARNGSRALVGKCAIVDKDGMAFGAFMAKYSSPFNQYIKLFIDSPSFRQQLDGVKTETINQITQDVLKNQLCPLPPVNEQIRIVEMFYRLLPYIERYGKAEEHLTALNTTFPEALKKSILQEAVQGKLVPQNPDDEPASVLLERIKAEKQELIKQRKIKKNKSESVIVTRDKIPYEIIDGKERCIADEVPFEIPDSWCWCRWGTISESIQYGYNAPAKENGRIKMVRISDIQDNKVLWDTVPFCDIDEESIETYLLKQNDILFARTGGTVGKSYLVKEVPKDAIYAGYLIRTRYSNNLSPEYLKFFMESELYWIQLRNGTIATAQPNCNGKTLANMLVPIPPLAEQKRIVAKIEEIMPMIERLTLR